MDKVSIAIATYNGAKALREQLDSLYNQTVQPDEIFVSDDCSNDGTVEILEEYHIHLQTPAEKGKREKERLEKEKAEQINNVQRCTRVSAPEEESFETSATEVVEDDYKIPDVNEDYRNSVLFDPEDDPEEYSFYNPSETGWENHPFGGAPVGTVRKPIFNY